MTAPVDGAGAGPRPLEEEREFFLRSLRDLEEEWAAGDIDEVDYRALRDDYTARAAEVIRRLEGLDGAGEAGGDGSTVSEDASTVLVEEGEAGAGTDPAGAGEGAPAAGTTTVDIEESADAAEDPEAPAPSAGRRRRRRRRRPWPWWQKAMLVAAVASMAAAVGWQVGRGSSPRLAGDNVTGAGLSGQAVTQLLVDGQKAASKDPVTALKDFNRILAVYPDQPQALTDEGWVLAQGGVVSQGEADLKRAEQIDPGYGITHAYLGIILGDQGDYAGAVTQLQYYLSHKPSPALAGEARSALAVAQKDLKAAKSGKSGG